MLWDSPVHKYLMRHEREEESKNPMKDSAFLRVARKVGSEVISAPSSHGARAPKSKVPYLIDQTST